MNKKYSLAAVGAGCFWGSMGFFRRSLDSIGISAIGVISIRCLIAAVFFALLILFTDKKAFRIKFNDLWVFAGAGIMSILVFGWCYFKAMDHMSLSAAAILLYTAPCFVILMSAVLFNEKLTGRKLIAMVIAFVGCALVSGIGGGAGSLTPVGLALGLGSGICYALYSIFSRVAINKGYSALTVNVYSLLFSGVTALIFDSAVSMTIVFSSATNLLYAVGTGLVTGFMPYLLFTYALTGLDNGKTSIMASIEPVIATILGAIVYNETVSLTGILGIALVLAAIVMLNINVEKELAK